MRACRARNAMQRNLSYAPENAQPPAAQEPALRAFCLRHDADGPLRRILFAIPLSLPASIGYAGIAPTFERDAPLQAPGSLRGLRRVPESFPTSAARHVSVLGEA